MPSAAFWRAWSIWAVSLVVTFTALGYTAGFGTLLADFPRALPVANWLGWLYLLGLGLCV